MSADSGLVNCMRVILLLLAALTTNANAVGLQGTSCVFPDLSGMTPVALQSGAASPSGVGGAVPGGRWELVAVRYASAFAISGSAVGALELDAGAPTAGDGSLALNVTITSPLAETIDEVGAGPYAATGSLLSFQNDCGDELLLGQAEYEVDSSGAKPTLTLWGTIEITDPFPTTIEIETAFLLVEPTGAADEIFEDRFEVP